ncbi:hypothetical protein HJFPF1_07361 [Paramyrothecium foliicola]|nr:hypothetical protein HJFPF1_07361 [Paramyrothecium foliicola]
MAPAPSRSVVQHQPVPRPIPPFLQSSRVSHLPIVNARQETSASNTALCLRPNHPPAMSFERDDALCHRYAQFASHMVRWQFKIIYWTMFITNLLVLFLASWTYTKYVTPLLMPTLSFTYVCPLHRGQEALQRFEHQPAKRNKSLRTYIFLCLGCVLVSTVIVVMEVYALLALQFCDGEDLMSLYWSTWTMIQVGSLIAMIGIILALLHSLRDLRHPPWALALGTPVLVIAGVLHLFHDCTSKRVKSMRKSVDMTDGPPISQVNTIQVPDEYDDSAIHGEFIGFTVEGGPIVKFLRPPQGPLPSNAELLGHCGDDNRPLIAYRKNSIRFLSGSELEPEEDPEKAEVSPKTTLRE